MTGTNYTPGPWTHERNPGTAATWNVLADGTRVAEVLAGPSKLKKGYFGDIYVDREDAVDGPHNARLIAAAPELLRALEIAERTLSDSLHARGYEEGECTDGWSAEIRAEVAALVPVRTAIASATGHGLAS